MKKRIILIISFICIFIVFIFVSCRNTFELGFDTWFANENEIRVFENNIDNFDVIINIILKNIDENKSDYQQEISDHEEVNIEIIQNDKYSNEQNEIIDRINKQYDTDEYDLQSYWRYNGDSIYIQDALKKYRLVYSLDNKKTAFSDDEYGYWKGTKIKDNWYFYAYVYKN